ncbi:MAG: histidine kinase dimerization/phospho-acceptor domain-containing protein, partial [Clostridium sp.]
MNSIKTKLIIAISLILSIFIIGIMSFALMFKPYYINIKLDEMNLVTTKLENLLSYNDLEKVNSYTTMVSDKYTIQIDILDSSNKNILNPNNLKGNPKGTFNSLGSKNTCRIKKTLPDVDNLKRYILHDKSTGVDFLTTTKDFNKYNIYTRAPISVIDDSLNKSIRLLLIIMIPVSILAILITYLFSEKFTRPIKLITNKAIDLQSLKFTSPLEIQSNDEIEELAKSFNYLSSKIESSLNELTRKNSSLKHYIKKEKENESHRREFVSSVSHELKTPITVISGYAQALKTKIVTTDKDKDFYL